MLSSLRDAAALSAPPATVSAPLFKSLVDAMEEDKRQVVLDLGAASTEMLSTLGRSRSRVEIVDLAHFGGVQSLNSAEPGAELDCICDALLPNPEKSEKFDLVFCWDLPNYLSLTALSALMRAVGRRCNPRAMAHVLIAYSAQQMAEHPAHFMPTASADLIDRKSGKGMVESPRFTSEALSNHVGKFIVDRVRLLSNGMQEYLLRYER